MHPITAIHKLHRRAAKQSKSLKCLRHQNCLIATSCFVQMDRNSLKNSHAVSYHVDPGLYAFLLPRV